MKFNETHAFWGKICHNFVASLFSSSRMSHSFFVCRLLRPYALWNVHWCRSWVPWAFLSLSTVWLSRSWNVLLHYNRVWILGWNIRKYLTNYFFTMKHFEIPSLYFKNRLQSKSQGSFSKFPCSPSPYNVLFAIARWKEFFQVLLAPSFWIHLPYISFG